MPADGRSARGSKRSWLNSGYWCRHAPVHIPLFLYVESLVFNFPSHPPSVIRQGRDVFARDVAVGDPLELRRFLLPIFVGFGLQALNRG